MGKAGQLCGEGKQRTQSGQKSPALLFHDTAEMLFQWKVIGSFFWGKKKKGSDDAAPNTAGAFL